MKKSKSIILVTTVLGLCLLIIIGNVLTVKAENIQTVEGVWKVTSSNYPDKDGGYTIIRQGDGYNAIPTNAERGGNKYHGVGLYYGSSTEISAKQVQSFDSLVDMAKGSNIPASVLGELADKVTLRFRFKLSVDGQSMELTHDTIQIYHYPKTGRLAKYEINPYADRATLVRVSGPVKVEARGDRAYQADCGVVDPNRTTPITTDLCPGNLVAMTYFCGGGTGCPYVC
jgi:hypothetical protein